MTAVIATGMQCSNLQHMKRCKAERKGRQLYISQLLRIITVYLLGKCPAHAVVLSSSVSFFANVLL